MDVTITARHCTITDTLRSQAEERVSRLKRFEPRVTGATVCFVKDNGARQAEVRVTVPAMQPIKSQGDGNTFRTALDRAVERVESQLRKRHSRRRDHRAVPLGEAPLAEPAASAE